MSKRLGVDPATVRSEAWTPPATMQSHRPDNVRMRLASPPVRVVGRARESAPAAESLPYAVRLKGRERRYQHGRDAIAFARKHRDAQVWYTGDALVRLDYAEQILPCSDKAKPPKGGMGAFCKGQSSKRVNHSVARSAPAVRVF